ncbi:MAG TPA: tat (twin-arginine translocation) pathway signal sequence, partial [Bacteroidetes bacterium]|nr:tat (twin-arginine translocation) pathway signal sequence [Bacteroidota bacterium]
MDRRTFFQKSIGFSALAGLYAAQGRKQLLASVLRSARFDLVAVRGGEPEVLFP